MAVSFYEPRTYDFSSQVYVWRIDCGRQRLLSYGQTNDRARRRVHLNRGILEKLFLLWIEQAVGVDVEDRHGGV